MIQRGLQFLQGWEQGELPQGALAPERHARVRRLRPLAGRPAGGHRAGQGRRAPRATSSSGSGRAGTRSTCTRKSLLSLTLANLDDDARARTALRNVLQYLEQNEETQVAWLRTPEAGLVVLVEQRHRDQRLGAARPRAARARRARSRRGSSSGCSTTAATATTGGRRATRRCASSAMSDFVLASGEGEPDYTIRFDLDDGAGGEGGQDLEGELLHLRQPLRRGGRRPRRRRAHAEDHARRARAPLYLNTYLALLHEGGAHHGGRARAEGRAHLLPAAADPVRGGGRGRGGPDGQGEAPPLRARPARRTATASRAAT